MVIAFPPTLSTRARVLLALMSCLVWLTSCSTVQNTQPLPTAKSVDLNRYAGTWYELARLPMWAQRHCLTALAEYRLLDSGTVGVRNACTTTSGDDISIEGTATVVNTDHRSKLHVVFHQWAAQLADLFTDHSQGNYWILRVDPEYRIAVVGTPNREYLWILSRTPSIDETTYQNLVTFAQSLGFNTDQLIRRRT